MAEDSIVNVLPEICWKEIGVWGNSTCPELRRVGHCRNCEVYTASGRRLLERPATPDYIDTWTATLAEEHIDTAAMTSPHLVFRIGQAWLALPASNLREITKPSAVRTVPHRPLEILRGLVNVRGELYPCVSLHALFGEEAPPSSRSARFLVARGSGGDWVFPVDEVEGMRDVSQREVQDLPMTLAKTDVVYTQGLFPSGKKTVAIIDEGLLFGMLVRRIA
jgi:chemotaxis-related protein WspD